jgi:bla regulator protein blaR1
MNTLSNVIDFSYACGEYGIVFAIYAGVFAGLLAAIVLPINLLVRRWLTAGQMSILWSLVLIRLLIPMAPSSALSLQGLLSRSEERIPVISSNSDVATVAMDGMSIPASAEPYAIAVATESSTLDYLEDMAAMVLPFLWVTAALLIVSWTALVNWRFSRQVHKASLCSNPRLLDLWQECCRLAGVLKQVPIILCQDVSQPAVMGVWRVKLLLPVDAADLTDDQLRMIMLHELAHIRRHDVAANWLLVAVRAAQWWNPVYWLASSRFNSLREQACDAFVLQRLAGQSSRNYGELLLTLAERTPVPARWQVLLPVPILGFFLSAFRRRAITARLRALSHAAIRPSRIQTLAIGLATLLLAFAGLTDAKPEASTVGQSFNSVDEWMDRGEAKPRTAAAPVFPGMFASADTARFDPVADAEPQITRDYDVEQTLIRIAGQKRSLDEARKDLKSLFLLPAPSRANSSLRSYDPKRPHDAMRNAVSLAANQPKPRYELNGNRLTVTASHRIHEDLRQKLTAWSESGLGQISVEVRFLTINRDVASKAKISWRYFAPQVSESDTLPLPMESSEPSQFRATAQVEEYIPIVYSILAPAENASLINAAQSDRRANVLQAPKFTVFNGQSAFVSDVAQTPFVVGVNETAEGVFKPQIAVADQGTKITLRPVLCTDHSHIRLSGRVEFHQVGTVRTASVGSSATPNAEPVTIQVPNVKRLRIDIATQLKDGHSLLLGSSPEVEAQKDSQHLYVLLTPQLLKETLD